MAEFDHDNIVDTPHDKNKPWFNIPSKSKLVIETHVVHVEPETKFYLFCMALARAFALASLIAWFIFLVLMIMLVFSMLNDLEVLRIMRDQQALLGEKNFDIS